MDFSDIHGFCDLNINSAMNVKLLERILLCDYRVIALNWTIDESTYEPDIPQKKLKNHQSQEDVVPIPSVDITKYNDLMKKHSKKLKILKRLTVIVSKSEQLKRVLNSKNLKHFDLLSALPKNQEAFQYVVSVTNVNIISFEVGLTEYKPAAKLYKQAVDRGGYFEISYAQALQSSLKRQELITMAQFLHIYGKSKNIIISSGASHVLELRSPYDVANLALLFGLNPEKGKCALSKTCRDLILQVEGKKFGKSAIVVESLEENTEQGEPQRKKIKIDESEKSAPLKKVASSSTTSSNVLKVKCIENYTGLYGTDRIVLPRCN